MIIIIFIAFQNYQNSKNNLHELSIQNQSGENRRRKLPIQKLHMSAKQPES